MKRVIILARASSAKQIEKGNTLEDQIFQCEEYIKKQNWIKVKVFPLVESGFKVERNYFEEVINFCKNKNNKIDFVVFKNISRFTRGGDSAYLALKNSLDEVGVQLRDIYGTIKEKVNTMAIFGYKYDWSEKSPSQSEETYEANKARDYVRDSLTQMIGAEILYTRKGYWRGSPPYGFTNIKTETAEDGKRTILIGNEKESNYIKTMFDLKSAGKSYDEIVTRINKMGFKTRRISIHDPRSKKVIGYKGNQELSIKQLQRYLLRLTYAGIVCEKWTNSLPIKGKFEGIVSVDTFNKANIGKIKIIQDKDNVQVKYGPLDENERIIIRRNKYNPLYPFKGIILCPKCRGGVLGSANTGKYGVKFPAYHCSRKHKLWRIPKDKFETTISEFLKKVKFSKEYTKLFEQVFIEVWKEKRSGALDQSHMAEKNVLDLVGQQKQILDTIKTTRIPSVISALETEFDDLDKKIINARENRTEKEHTELEIKEYIISAKELMEHPENILVDKANPVKQAQLFNLLFEKYPTYDELLNGTPKLNGVFQLKQETNLSKEQLVNYLFSKWNTFILYLEQAHNTISNIGPSQNLAFNYYNNNTN